MVISAATAVKATTSPNTRIRRRHAATGRLARTRMRGIAPTSHMMATRQRLQQRQRCRRCRMRAANGRRAATRVTVTNGATTVILPSIRTRRRHADTIRSVSTATSGTVSTSRTRSRCADMVLTAAIKTVPSTHPSTITRGAMRRAHHRLLPQPPPPAPPPPLQLPPPRRPLAMMSRRRAPWRALPAVALRVASV